MFYLCFLLFFGQAAASSEANDIKVDYTETVTLVDLPIRVLRGGSFYDALRPELLQIVENGVQLKAWEVREVETPLTLHFLLDISSSNANGLQFSKRVVADLLEESRPRDKAKISSISAVYRPLTDYIGERHVLEDALGSLEVAGTTALYDGLANALRELSKVSGNRVLVVFSDGHDLMSTTADGDLVELVHNFRVPILFVRTGGGDRQGLALLQAQERFVNELARASGGAVLSNRGAVRSELHRRMRAIRQRYLVRFSPPEPNDLQQWRSLVLSVRDCPDCQLIYRSAYSIDALTRTQR